MSTEIMMERVELNQMSWKMLSRQNGNLCHNKHVPASSVGDNRKLHQTLHFLPSGDVGVVASVPWLEISYIRKIQMIYSLRGRVCMFLFTDTMALVHSNRHTLVTEIYLVLLLLTRANRQIRVMHGGMCIPLTWFCEFVGDKISRPAGISYLSQAATWEIFFIPLFLLKECHSYMIARFILSNSHHYFPRKFCNNFLFFLLALHPWVWGI